MEDFELCEKAQANLERGVYGEGVLNPLKENGVLFYQGRVREFVYRQFQEEKSAKEIEENDETDAVGKVGREAVGITVQWWLFFLGLYYRNLKYRSINAFHTFKQHIVV